MATVNTDAIQKLYIAYFNRPADVTGLAYWEKQLADKALTIEGIAQSFSVQAEYATTYAGKSNGQIVEAIYKNMLGRSADLAGFKYWIAQLDAGAVKLGTVALAIANGAAAGSDDAKVVANKIAAANAFTDAMDSTAKILSYTGDNAFASARSFLTAVTAVEATKTAAVAGAADAVVNPSTATNVNPSTATNVNPSTATNVNPSTATIVNPSTATNVNPSTATNVNPSTATIVNPSTATIVLDTTADADNNLSIVVSPSDKIANSYEVEDISVLLAGIDVDAISAVVTFTDGVNTPVTTTAVKLSGVWTLSDSNISSLKDGTVAVTLVVTDGLGNTATSTDTLYTNTDSISVGINRFDGGDRWINNVEDNGFIISGKAIFFNENIDINTPAIGAEVNLIIFQLTDGEVIRLTTTVGKDGVWSVASGDLSGLYEGGITIEVYLLDNVLNMFSFNMGFSVHDSVAPTLTMNDFDGADAFLSIAERGAVVFSGTAFELSSLEYDYLYVPDTITVTYTDGATTGTTTGLINYNSHNDDSPGFKNWATAAVNLTGFGPNITVTATMSDNAGNAATPAVRTTTLNNLAPMGIIPDWDKAIKVDSTLNMYANTANVISGAAIGYDGTVDSGAIGIVGGNGDFSATMYLFA
jgi:hypothetical protein